MEEGGPKSFSLCWRHNWLSLDITGPHSVNETSGQSHPLGLVGHSLCWVVYSAPGNCFWKMLLNLRPCYLGLVLRSCLLPAPPPGKQAASTLAFARMPPKRVYSYERCLGEVPSKPVETKLSLGFEPTGRKAFLYSSLWRPLLTRFDIGPAVLEGLL